MEAHQHWAAGVNDPLWAWCIAFGYHQSQEPLPALIRDQNIHRAYRLLKGACDDQMATTLGIRTSSKYGKIRPVLQGFLCACQIYLESIASLLGLDTGVVQAGRGFVFNDRNREGTYTLNRIFPQTGLGAVLEAELRIKRSQDAPSSVGTLSGEELMTRGVAVPAGRDQQALVF